jgi:hypothetical protein
MIRLTATGHCLDPVLQHGDAFYLDTQAVPQDGDLVSVQVSRKQHARFIALAEHKPEFRAAYGGSGLAVVSKRLRAMGGDWYCCTNTSAFMLEGGRVLGVIRKIDKGQGGAPGVCGTACAATVDAEVYSDIEASVSAAGTNTNAINVDVTKPGTLEIQFSGQLTCSTFSGAGNVLITGTQSGGTGSFAYQPIATGRYAVTGASQVIRFTHTTVYQATGSGPWQIRCGWTDDGSGNQFTAQNLGLRVIAMRGAS